jgi:hypothetical protein
MIVKSCHDVACHDVACHDVACHDVAFRPRRMSPEELLEAHRRLWCRAFGLWLTSESHRGHPLSP